MLPALPTLSTPALRDSHELPTTLPALPCCCTVFLSQPAASSSLPVLEVQAREVHYGSDPQDHAAAGDDEEYGTGERP